MSNLPGYGDSATWPAFNGHPNDPRNPDADAPDGWDEEEREHDEEDGDVPPSE
jgi:hypothetical protein